MLRKFLAFALVICAGVLLGPQYAIGQLVTYSYSGTITEISLNENNVIPDLKIGDSFTGFTRFESAGWHNTAGVVFASLNGVDLEFDGQTIFGGVEFSPSLYSIRVAADAGGDIGDSTFQAFNFGPDLADTDGSAGHNEAFPSDLNLSEFEENIFRIGGRYLPTGDNISITGRLDSFTSSVLLGDVNMDSEVNFLDIAPFIALLTTGDTQAEADVDKNGTVDFLDISPFILILSGP